ncbi:hypothetical protein EV715DRAFT_278143 [Schizophyllum commune]
MQALLPDAAFAFPPTTTDAYAATAPRVPSRTFAPSHARTPCPAIRDQAGRRPRRSRRPARHPHADAQLRDTHAFGDDEEDELPEDHPPPAGATDQEKIEYRRRRNTLAARRSRQKKADKMATLEDDVRRLTSERDTWKTRAQTLRQLLLSHGIPCKEFED